MKSTMIVACLATALPVCAFAALHAGDAAPDFSAPAALAGKTIAFSLAEARKAGPVVVYFYPAAFTSGCNVQAHEFAVNMDRFKAAGATVIGVSLDNITRLTAFSADPKYCAGKVPVASDADGRIAASFQLAVDPEEKGFKDTRGIEVGHGFDERTTFIVGTDGKIVAAIGGLEPAENVRKSLTAVTLLRTAAPDGKH
jgi:peroxiredoxin